MAAMIEGGDMTQITEKDSDVRRRIQVALDHGAHAIDADDVRELLATAHHDCPDCGGSGIVGTLPADGGAVHYEPCTRCGGLGSIGVRRPASCRQVVFPRIFHAVRGE